MPETPAETDLHLLQNELSASLRQVERSRKIVRLCQVPIYGIALLWMLLVIGSAFVAPYLGYQLNTNYILTGFVPAALLLMILQFVFSRAYASFARREQQIMTRLVKTLFPKASYRSGGNDLSLPLLQGSHLFTGLRGNMTPYLQFASVSLPTAGGELKAADIGIATSGRVQNALDATGVGGILALYKGIVKPLFASRVDRSLFDFRGMFAWMELQRRVDGRVAVLPDRLEGKLGYLARSFQKIKEAPDNCLVQMEDPAFERYFAVYASDEVLARRVLTPAMMRRITALREKYGREIMLSFNANRFYLAVSMPGGFLSLRGGQSSGADIVSEIYDDIAAAGSVAEELRLNPQGAQTVSNPQT